MVLIILCSNVVPARMQLVVSSPVSAETIVDEVRSEGVKSEGLYRPTIARDKRRCERERRTARRSLETTTTASRRQGRQPRRGPFTLPP